MTPMGKPCTTRIARTNTPSKGDDRDYNLEMRATCLCEQVPSHYTIPEAHAPLYCDWVNDWRHLCLPDSDQRELVDHYSSRHNTNTSLSPYFVSFWMLSYERVIHSSIGRPVKSPEGKEVIQPQENVEEAHPSLAPLNFIDIQSQPNLTPSPKLHHVFAGMATQTATEVPTPADPFPATSSQPRSHPVHDPPSSAAPASTSQPPRVRFHLGTQPTRPPRCLSRGGGARHGR